LPPNGRSSRTYTQTRPVSVWPFARIGTVVSSPFSRSAARTWASINACSGRSAAAQAAHLVGQRRQAQVDAFARVALALPVQRLMLAELLEQDHRQKARSGKAARRDMERRRRLRDRFALAAGKSFANLWITFHWRGMTSSVSVTSSPSFESFVDPQHWQFVGAATTIRSRSKCSGKAFAPAACVRRI
jgi:hypothetical protein